MPVEKGRSFRFNFWLIVIMSGNIFFSCANEDCVSIFNNHLLVSFIDADTLESGGIEFHEIDTLFYSVVAVGNDTVFYDSTDVVSTVRLSVDPASDLTTFVFQMLDSISYDTLSNDPIVIDTSYHVNPNPHIISVSYNRSQRIMSEDCGVEIAYTKLKLEEITFQTAVLTDDKLSRLNEVNIEVFF